MPSPDDRALIASWMVLALLASAALGSWASAEPVERVASSEWPNSIPTELVDGGCDVVHQWDTGCEP